MFLESLQQVLKRFQNSKEMSDLTQRGGRSNLCSSSSGGSRPPSTQTLVTFHSQLQMKQMRCLWKRNFTRNKPAKFHSKIISTHKDMAHRTYGLSNPSTLTTLFPPLAKFDSSLQKKDAYLKLDP